ncbi:MAG: hypothetical protein QM639_05255 [Rhodocyclaceae bacterium]
MSATASLICSPRLTFAPEDAGTGMAPPRGLIDHVWFALFGECDLRFIAVPGAMHTAYVPYLTTPVSRAYQRVSGRPAFWRALSTHRPALSRLLDHPAAQTHNHLILDLWAVWARTGDRCTDLCLAHIRTLRRVRMGGRSL